MASQRQTEANRRNWAMRRGLTEGGRQRLREAAFRNQSWRRSTGPKTPAGKAQARMNARKSGKHDAIHRATLAWAWAAGRFVSLWFGSCSAVLRIPCGLRWDATFGQLVARKRQAFHELPMELDTDTATAWLRQHRRLGSLPLSAEDLPGIPDPDRCRDLPLRLLAEAPLAWPVL
ncbi:MAG TPA: hypothetical protein VM487_19335 [Phycisphaerae bacterium]|nr:hypothetical protein [Phycisphaerae bacterium]